MALLNRKQEPALALGVPNVGITDGAVQNTGVNLSGLTLSSKKEIVISLNDFPIDFFDASYQSRIEFLRYTKVKNSIKKDTNGVEYQHKRPAGWVHPTPMQGGNPQGSERNGMRYGSHSNRNDAVTEWYLTGLSNTDKIVIPVAETFATWFATRRISDNQNNSIDTIITSEKSYYGATEGGRGVSTANKLNIAFRFAVLNEKTGRFEISANSAPIVIRKSISPIRSITAGRDKELRVNPAGDVSIDAEITAEFSMRHKLYV